jgi:aspartyl-tRNA(Asn)/glutamyl-tRNA(Gln) amidotransferase subunit A
MARGIGMSESAPGWIVDLLRTNLRQAGIPLAEHDLERILEMGLLRTALAFAELEAETPADVVPDSLGYWGGSESAGPAEPAPGRSASAAVAASQDLIAGVAALLQRRAISPVELTERALVLIAARDPDLNAFQLVLANGAREAARSAEREIASGRYRGPLHGVPLAVKDLLDMAGTPTSAGSSFHAGRTAARDSRAVARLREAGAILVGKTRLAEFAYSPGSNNGHFGPTRNPHDPTRDTGGSSSGSGAAVAAGMVFGALGSDTGGSIRIPSSLCGIVGIKPTFGRVSLAGATPLAWSLDHLGPMTRTVRDAALVLGVLAGDDAADPRTREVPVPDYTAALESGVRGMRIGVPDRDGDPEPIDSLPSFNAWSSGLRALEAAGAMRVTVDLRGMADLRVVNGALLAMEAAAFHRPMLRERAAEYGEFARLRLLAAHAYAPGAYLRAQQARAIARAGFERALDGVDRLSTPTMPGGAPALGVPAPTRFTAPFNLLGWPAISVPIGLTAGALPLGLQLVGPPWAEAQVLRAARVVERALGAEA